MNTKEREFATAIQSDPGLIHIILFGTGVPTTNITQSVVGQVISMTARYAYTMLDAKHVCDAIEALLYDVIKEPPADAQELNALLLLTDQDSIDVLMEKSPYCRVKTSRYGDGRCSFKILPAEPPREVSEPIAVVEDFMNPPTVEEEDTSWCDLLFYREKLIHVNVMKYVSMFNDDLSAYALFIELHHDEDMHLTETPVEKASFDQVTAYANSVKVNVPTSWPQQCANNIYLRALYDHMKYMESKEAQDKYAELVAFRDQILKLNHPAYLSYFEDDKWACALYCTVYGNGIHVLSGDPDPKTCYDVIYAYARSQAENTEQDVYTMCGGNILAYTLYYQMCKLNESKAKVEAVNDADAIADTASYNTALAYRDSILKGHAEVPIQFNGNKWNYALNIVMNRPTHPLIEQLNPEHSSEMIEVLRSLGTASAGKDIHDNFGGDMSAYCLYQHLRTVVSITHEVMQKLLMLNPDEYLGMFDDYDWAYALYILHNCDSNGVLIKIPTETHSLIYVGTVSGKFYAEVPQVIKDAFRDNKYACAMYYDLYCTEDKEDV